MKLRAERDTLLAALGPASRVAAGPSRPLWPSALHLSLKGDALTVSGADPDIIVTTRTIVDGDEDGTVALSSRLLTDIVKAFDDGTVSIESGTDETSISLGRATFTVRPVANAELNGPAVTAGDASSLDAKTLAAGLRQVTFAALKDDSRAPQLCGVLLAGKDDRLRIVASDSYRLAIRDIDLAPFGNGDSSLVPARALLELQRLIDDDADTVTIVTDERSATFSVGSTSITTRLIAGAFPDYERLIPDEYPSTFSADRADLIGAVKRVRIVLAAEKSGTVTPVRLTFSPLAVDLSATAETAQATERVDGKLLGADEGLVAFNPAYLLDALEAIDGGEVNLSFVDHSKPALIRGSDLDARCLLMPVRTS